MRGNSRGARQRQISIVSPEPEHLVGPSLYPYWMFGVKTAIAIQGVAALVTLIVRMLNGHDCHMTDRAAQNPCRLSGALAVLDLRVLEYAGRGFTDLCDHFRQPRAATMRQRRART